MPRTNWSVDTIVEELYSLHKDNVSLIANRIQQASSGLHNAIYYKQNGIPVYFGSLANARESTALHAESLGETQKVEEIRKFNGKRVSPKKITNEKLLARKNQFNCFHSIQKFHQNLKLYHTNENHLTCLCNTQSPAIT